MNQANNPSPGAGSVAKFAKLPGAAGGETWFVTIDGQTVEYGWSYSANVRAFRTNYSASCRVGARIMRGTEVVNEVYTLLNAPKHYAGARKYVRENGHLDQVRAVAQAWANGLLSSSDGSAKR